MSTQFFWTLPPSGDGRAETAAGWTRGDLRGVGRRRLPSALTDPSEGRYGYHDYLLQVARAAEASGFDGAIIPWEPTGEDPWIVAASLARATRRIALVPELEPAFATPVYLAKMSATLQRISHHRLGWKIAVDREASVRRAHGDFLEGDEWRARTDEYLEAAKGVWTQRPYELRGKYYEVEAGGLDDGLAGHPLPRLFTSGSSDAAIALAARHADTHLVDWEGSLDAALSIAARVDAASANRVRKGLRATIITRHTDAEAQSAASELGSSSLDAFIGSYDALAAWIDALVRAGVDVFALRAPPHLEEAYRFGEHVLPRIASRFAPRPQSPLASQQGAWS